MRGKSEGPVLFFSFAANKFHGLLFLFFRWPLATIGEPGRVSSPQEWGSDFSCLNAREKLFIDKHVVCRIPLTDVSHV